jgi:CubicO group peptidase (beta-lactamase class C family)
MNAEGPGPGRGNPGSRSYVLLGAIIEHTTGRPRADVLRSDVLDHPGLEGLAYTVADALAADGYGVRSTPASLARWGYELFGGHVLSEASLREMTHFYQDPCCDFRYGPGVWDLSGEYGTLTRPALRLARAAP